MSSVNSVSHLIQQLWESEQWEDLAPMLDSALAGERYSGQELLIMCAAASKLGRLAAARVLLNRALETGIVSKQEAAQFLFGHARRSLAKCGVRGSSNNTPTNLSLSGLTRWYRPEGALGVYVSSRLSELPLGRVSLACSQLVERLAGCSSKAVLSDDIQRLVVNSGFEALFSPTQRNLLQPFSSDFDGLRVLELGCQGGRRARFLAENGASVTAVTANPEHALLTAALCKDLPNVQVVLDAPHTVPFRGLYDLVVVAGYQEEFVASATVLNPLGHIINRAYSALAPNGSLLLSGHNALALRHFNDQRDVYGREGAAALEGRVTPGVPQLLPPSMIRSTLTECGFYRQEHCVVMGTLDCPQLLVSPLGMELSGGRWNLETLVRRALRDSDKDRLARFSDSRVMHTIVEAGQFQAYSDGYLFLAHKSAEQQVRIDGWLASYFISSENEVSGHESRFQLVEGQEGDIEVIKHSLNGSGLEAGRPYVGGEVYRDILDDLLQVPGWNFEQVLHWSAVWLRCLLSSLYSDDPLMREGELIGSYASENDLWVPDRLLGSGPEQWIKTDKGNFKCLYMGKGTGATVPMAMVLYAGLISTFSTLRSVAKPSDNIWLKPAELAKKVITQLGYSIQSGDVDVLSAHWTKVMGTPLPVPGYFMAREVPRALTDSAKLYWATELEGFSESNSSTDNLVLDGSIQTLRLAIASHGVRVTGLRFDVANRPGCFEVEEMVVIQADGEVLWSWQHLREELYGVQGAALVIDSEVGRSCVLSRGNDPQFVLNLSQTVLAAAAGGVFQVRVSAWPQRL